LTGDPYLVFNYRTFRFRARFDWWCYTLDCKKKKTSKEGYDGRGFFYYVEKFIFFKSKESKRSKTRLKPWWVSISRYKKDRLKNGPRGAKLRRTKTWFLTIRVLLVPYSLFNTVAGLLRATFNV
jgi:hypothetical protein